MCLFLTVELQRSIPHGPARRAEQSEGHDGYRWSKLEHSYSQTWATHQRLQRVNRTHLEEKEDDNGTVSGYEDQFPQCCYSLCLQTCGRSRVWSQFCGRGVLAVSSKVCMLWANSGLALLASSADTTPRMSIGNPAARRVTDVERGHCTTCNPYQERIQKSPASPFINETSHTSVYLYSLVSTCGLEYLWALGHCCSTERHRT